MIPAPATSIREAENKENAEVEAEQYPFTSNVPITKLGFKQNDEF